MHIYKYTYIEISSFQNGLNNPCYSNFFYHKSKIVGGSHEMQNYFLKFYPLSLKMYLFEVVIFLLA